MTDVDVPPDFIDPEGDGELQDPDLMHEAPTSTLRHWWREWMCRSGGGDFADPRFFGRTIGGVPRPAVAAFSALEAALRSTGYQPDSQWAYNCRLIAGTSSYSLHSAGIAVDIDPVQNPYSHGDKYSGRIKKHHVDAALAIKNGAGNSVWSWGGNWSKPDRMHFQLDQRPSDVDVDWETVPEGYRLAEEGNVLAKGTGGRAVRKFQRRLKAWDEEALPEWGPDGDYGDETVEWVGKFQRKFGLDTTGVIDGVTAALLLSDPPQS